MEKEHVQVPVAIIILSQLGDPLRKDMCDECKIYEQCVYKET